MSDFYQVLIAELRDDPLGVGYANMTDYYCKPDVFCRDKKC